MQNTPSNIFSSIYDQQPSTIQSIKKGISTFLNQASQRIKSISASIKLNQQTSVKISESFQKSKQFINQNKQLILGVSIIAVLYIANHKRTQKNKKKQNHIHSLTSSPNNSFKRSSNHKRQQKSSENLSDMKQNGNYLKSSSNNKNKKSNIKLNYLKAFISQDQQQEESYIRSDEEDKQNPDLSTSTRRTESMMSDIQPLKKKKKKNLQPILDLVEQQDQTQDRVFFQMYQTYRQS